MATRNGTARGDRIDGTAEADRLFGFARNDLLIGLAGDDFLDGGSGNDSLRLDGSRITLDLDGLAGTRVRSVEHIDLRGSGANSLSLRASDVLALDVTDHTLFVRGNADDTVHSAGQGWQQDSGGPVLVAGVQYAAYSVGAAHLLVELGVQTSLG